MFPAGGRCSRICTRVQQSLSTTRAFRWRRMLEDGRYASVSDIARAEKIDRTYAGDILRLTLLSPEIVEAIVEGLQPAEMTLPVLMKPFAVAWVEQHVRDCPGEYSRI